MAKSIIILGTYCHVARLPPVLHAYGAPDDHHRLTHLLADRVEQILGREDEHIHVCRDRRSVWSDRLRALRRALEDGMNKCRTDYAFAIADIDALLPQGQDDLDERGIWACYHRIVDPLRNGFIEPGA